MPDAGRSSRSQSFAVGVGGLTGVPLIARFVALDRRDLALTWDDLAGIAGDLGIAALAVAGIALLPRRWLRAVAGGLWGLVHWAHLEHVVALDAPLSLRYAGFVRDPEFFFGSVLRPTTLLPGLMLVVLGVLAGFLLPRAGRRVALPTAAAGGVLTALLLLLPGPHSWRDRHFVASELARLRPGAAADAVPSMGDTEPPDLSGERRIEALAGRPNVLVLVLESVSGAYLPRLGLSGNEPGAGTGPGEIVMPNLSRLVDESVTARLVLTHQRQTNRGLWALLCGRLPDLRSGEAKLTRLARSGERLPCLPEAFGRAGYRTLFQQAAPLSFMVKDQAMAAIGFEEVRGDESLPRAYRRSFWGVDDRAFLEQAAELARRLEDERARNERPWFLTLLTVGTHHPFTVPEGEATLANAVAVLDDALEDFFAELGASGVLDDTLVVVTSDESAGTVTGDDWTRAFSQNVGMLLLRYPDGRTAMLEGPVAQRDVAATVADAVQLPVGSPSAPTALSGRSALRRQPPRPILLGNTFLDRTYGYFPPDALLVCDGAGRGCRTRPFDPGAPLRSADSAEWTPADPARAERIARSVAASSLPPATVARHWTLGLHPHTLRELPRGTDGHLLYMGQSLHVPANTALDLELDLEIEGTRGWAHVRTDLLRRDRVPRVGLWISRLPVVGPGDRIRISLRLVTDEPIEGLDARGYLNVLFPGDLALRVHRADLTAGPAPEGAEPGVEVRTIEVDRSHPPPLLRAGLEDLEPLPEGLTWRQDGDGTAVEAVVEGPDDVVGPQIYVPRDSRIRLEATVEALEGASDVRLALGSPVHELVFGRTEPRTVLPGAPVDLELELTLDATLNEVGAVLFVNPREPTRLLVRRLSLEAELP